MEEGAKKLKNASVKSGKSQETDSPPEAPERDGGLADILTFVQGNCLPASGLQNCKRIICVGEATKLVAICYSSQRKRSRCSNQLSAYTVLTPAQLNMVRDNHMVLLASLILNEGPSVSLQLCPEFLLS